jgi:DtxR family transcriptional regulator, Mn-dependent transcriptional regulator
MTTPVKKISKKKPLTSVMEDYLEAIFDLDQEKRFVRVKDIAKKMDVKMPTVSSMLKTLNERGLVNYEKYEYVELTEDGKDVGMEMRLRHGIILKFLTQILKIDVKTADQDACKMEHALSPATMASLTDFIAFIQICPRTGDNWLQHFQEYRLHGHHPDQCLEKIKDLSCDFMQKMDALKDQKEDNPE